MVTAVFVFWSVVALQLGPIIACVAVLALLSGVYLARRLG